MTPRWRLCPSCGWTGDLDELETTQYGLACPLCDTVLDGSIRDRRTTATQ